MTQKNGTFMHDPYNKKKSSTGDPRFMQISLLQFFKTFQKILAYAFFEPIYFITAIFWLLWVQNLQ